MITTNTVTIEGNVISYQVHNEGEELLFFIHGWCSSRYFWNPTVKDFFQYGQCITMDLVGHYPSKASTDFKSYNILDIIRVQAKAIEALANGKKVTIVGHSTGATIAVGIAAYYPNLIKKVISISPVAHGPVRGLLQPAKLIADWKLDFINEITMKLVSLSEDLLEFWFSVAVSNKDEFFAIPGIKGFLSIYQSYFSKLDSKIMGLYLQILDKADIRQLIKEYTVPTLVLFGREDRIVPLEHGRIVARTLAGCNFILYEKSGHIPILEEKEKALQDIKNWMDQTST